MKKIFVLLVLSSIVPLCAMEREVPGDTGGATVVAANGDGAGSEAGVRHLKFNPKVDVWELDTEDEDEEKKCGELFDRMYELRRKGRIDDARLKYLEDALDESDANPKKIKKIEKRIAADESLFGQLFSEQEEEDLLSEEEDSEEEGSADFSGSEDSGSFSGEEDGFGDSTELAELSSADEEDSDAVLPPWSTSPQAGVAVVVSAAQVAKVERRDGDAPSDENADERSGSLSDEDAASEEGKKEGGDDELEVARVEALDDRLDQLEEKEVDVNYLHAALNDEEIPLDVVELMIVACEKKFEEGSCEGAQSDDDVMYTEKRLQCKVNRGAQSDGEEPKGEPMDLALAAPSRAARADEAAEPLAPAAPLVGEGDAAQSADAAREEEEEDLEVAAADERDEVHSDGSDGEEVEAPAASVVAAYEEDGGIIGDLDVPVDEAARARMEKQLELAVRLGRLRERSVEVADLWSSLGGEGTDLADLEKEINALEAGPERGASLSPGGKAGTAPADVGREWLKRAVQLPVLGKVAGVTFGVFVMGGLTHRHVRTRRAQGKPTIFDRMWSTSKQWKEKAERLVRRS